MKVIRNSGAVLALLGLLFSSPSMAVSISFEELGNRTCCFASEPALTNQYAAQGVVFSGGWEVLNQSGNFGFNAISGQHFAAFNTGTGGVTDTLGMAFASGVDAIAGSLASSSAGSWLISWFANNAFQGSTTVNNTGGNYVAFNLTGINADFVSIQASASAGALEDLSFNLTTVPEPAALALLGIALAGLSSHRRRARR